MDMNAIYTGVAAVGGTVLAAAAHAGRLYKKIKPVLDVLLAVGEHIKTNNADALREIAADVEQAATAPDQTSRNLLIKSAAQTALHALAIDIANLKDEQKFWIASFVASRMPEEWRGEISLAKINAVLQLISDEIDAANEHDGLKAMKAAAAWGAGM